MGSMSNPNPWSPYDSYNDCSQGVCNIYCPQWCYLIFPPPPPSSFLNDDSDDSSSSTFSPLLIALIGILVSAFILVSYYTLISKYCHRHHQNSSDTLNGNHNGEGIFSSTQRNSNTATGDGLNESMIKSITVYKYRKGDGFVDGSDCSVCLSEFEENESLRLLPKCNHAFHLPCIDTWLKSHSNCPLCRAFVTGINNPTTADVADSVVIANQSSSVHQTATEPGYRREEINSNVSGYQHQTGDSVVVIEDLGTGSRNSDGRSELQLTEEQREAKDEYPTPIRRSASLDSGIVVSIADVLREIEYDEEESGGVGTSQRREEGEENRHGEGKTPQPTEAETAANQRSGVSNFLVRSLSTGRFIFSRIRQALDNRCSLFSLSYLLERESDFVFDFFGRTSFPVVFVPI